MVTAVSDRTDGAEVYAEYVTEWLERERELSRAFESRGSAVIATTGAFVTLLFAVAGIVGDDERLLSAASSRPGVLLACLLFASAALSAIGIVMPQRHSDLDPEVLLEQMRASWDDPQSVALSRTTADRIAELRSLHRTNARKGLLLLVATASVAGGIVVLAVTVALGLPR